MNDVINKTWTALEGNLVFDIAIVRNGGHGASSARIYCRDNPQHFYTVSVIEGRFTEFNYKFNSGCYVYGYLKLQGHVHIDGVGHIGIFGDIRFGHAGKFDEHHFEGFMVTCKTQEVPIPPDPDYPVAPSPDPVLPVINSAHGELFPYIYIRKWPTVGVQELHQSFIQYQSTACSPPSSSFYDDLCAARSVGRGSMEDLALRFIQGDAPYQDEFVSSIDQLDGPIRRFPEIAVLALDMESRPDALIAAIEAIFGAKDRQDIQAYLTSSIYLGEKERIWQSYFALMIILGYDYGLLVGFIQILTVDHLLEYLFADVAEPPEVTPVLLKKLSHASIILPKAVFPLPPAATSPPCASPPSVVEGGWIEPYAIGDLQMVQQRLLRYEAGEIAYIENIMRGEKKEIGRKRIHRQIDYQKSEAGNDELLENQAADERNNLIEEARKAIAEKAVTNQYTDFKTNYGPPTQATLNGSWTESIQQGAHPGTDDVTRFAREILNKTVNRITRHVNQVRGSSTLNETEETVKSVIDNSMQQRNLMCVFRWLNKVYEAHVVNYGNRLMIEFMLQQPAACFIQEQQEFDGQSFVKPPPPEALGISSFKSISPDNYAQLAAAYSVTELEPPPAPKRYVSATLRSGEEKLVAIPPGYCASDAYVNFIAAPDGPGAPLVLVGREMFKPGADNPANRQFGEDSTMPISVIGYAASFSPPSEVDVLVNVEIACRPTDTAMDVWRIKIYNAILNGYQRQTAFYYNAGGVRSGERGPARSLQASRRIERGELKRGCMRLLLQRFFTLTGGADFVSGAQQPSQFSVNEPRYLQFFEEVFEWDEMTYRFYCSLENAGKQGAQDELGSAEDALFTTFLKADLARVMVPVHPSRTMALLYFLSSGAIWDGDNRLAPLNAGDTAVVNELKMTAMRMEPAGRYIGKPWEVLVPTSMQVLDGSGLDVFRGDSIHAEVGLKQEPV